MMLYQKTIYIEVEADDETDANNAVYQALKFATEDPTVMYVDFEGPMEVVHP